MKRGVALILAVIISVASAGTVWQLCLGWSSSAEARHACCKARIGELGPDTSTTCCAMAQQFRDRGPVKSSIAPELASGISLAAHVLPDLRDVVAAPWIGAGFSPPHSPPVPFYVRHRSLLI